MARSLLVSANSPSKYGIPIEHQSFASIEQLLTFKYRLKIWGFAAPDPYIVVQRHFIGAKHSYSYIRPVPAVLHVCKESRLEFLEAEDTTINKSSVRRRQDHPVYKLSFRGRLRSSPVFFSNVDIFWGTQYSVVPYRRGSPYGWAQYYSGIASLDIAKSLRHLVVINHARDIADTNFFHKAFPKLETLTFLIQGPASHPGSNQRYVWLNGTTVTLGGPLSPETDGELSTVTFSSSSKAIFEQHRAQINALLTRGKEKYPDWTPPVLKLRFLSQFMENERLTSGAGLQPQEELDTDSDFDEY
jgi:hypothetical protein